MVPIEACTRVCRAVRRWGSSTPRSRWKVARRRPLARPLARSRGLLQTVRRPSVRCTGDWRADGASPGPRPTRQRPTHQPTTDVLSAAAWTGEHGGRTGPYQPHSLTHSHPRSVVFGFFRTRCGALRCVAVPCGAVTQRTASGVSEHLFSVTPRNPVVVAAVRMTFK